MGSALIDALREIFPDVTSFHFSDGAATFDVNTGTLSATTEHAVADLLPKGWNSAGTAINYLGSGDAMPADAGDPTGQEVTDTSLFSGMTVVDQ